MANRKPDFDRCMTTVPTTRDIEVLKRDMRNSVAELRAKRALNMALLGEHADEHLSEHVDFPIDNLGIVRLQQWAGAPVRVYPDPDGLGAFVATDWRVTGT